MVPPFPCNATPRDRRMTEPGSPRRPRAAPWREAGVALALAGLLSAVYLINGEFLPGNDATANVYGAVNLLENGSFLFSASGTPWMFDWRLGKDRGETPAPILSVFDLQHTLGGVPFEQLRERGLLVPEPGYYLTRAAASDPTTGEPMFVNLFGPGTSVTALPFLAVLRLFREDLRSDPALLWFGAKAIASLLVAASSALLFLAMRRWLSMRASIILALLYGTGTCVWTSSSQALWQHAPNEFFLALGTLFLVRERGHVDALMAGFAYACAAACRPTSLAFLVAVAGFLALAHRPWIPAYALGSLPGVLGTFGYNARYLGSPFRFGQSQLPVWDSLWSTPLAEGLAGLLVSPSRGLLVFSPFLVFALAGAVIAWKRREFSVLRPLPLAVAAILLAHAKYTGWWGGHSYGYRIIVDLVVPLTLLIVPVWTWVVATSLRRGAFACLAAWSVLLQVLGLYAYDVQGWNERRAYVLVTSEGRRVSLDRDEALRLARSGRGTAIVTRLGIGRRDDRARLWSIRDSQIVYSLGHLQEARRARREGVADWLDAWTPRPPRHP